MTYTLTLRRSLVINPLTLTYVFVIPVRHEIPMGHDIPMDHEILMCHEISEFHESQFPRSKGRKNTVGDVTSVELIV